MKRNVHAFPLIVVPIQVIFALPACKTPVTQKPTNPNILILLADDLGYSDIACYEGIAKTPNLDKLANDGLILSNFYAGAPNSSPSRTALLTGRSPFRAGMYSYRPQKHPMHLLNNEVTIAEILKENGYETALFGKWHLGCLPQDTSLNHPQPDEQGFDYYFATEENAEPSHQNPVNFIRNGKPMGELKGYSCSLVANEAISWLEKSHNKQTPFFIYVAFHETHEKIASPPELIKKYSNYPEKDARYFANIENMDHAAGRIIDYLKEQDLIKNTLILFSSDNGSVRKSSNGKLREVKSYLYDGGIRIPCIIHWPALNQKSEIINEPAGFVDIMPTICDILKIQTPGDRVIDGTSILNLLNGKDFYREKPLFWFFYRTSPVIAVRIENYMILGKDIDSIPRTHHFSEEDMSYINEMDLVEYELYDLNADISEKNNLIEQFHVKDSLIQIVRNKLHEIQSEGYEWDQWPSINNVRKIKTDWLK